MNDFSFGPFRFEPAPGVFSINGIKSHRWTMRYGRDVLAEHTLPDDCTRSQIVEAFDADRSAFIRRASACESPVPTKRPIHAVLVESTDCVGVAGKTLGGFDVLAPIAGLSAGLIDDRFATWLVVPETLQYLPISADEFERLADAHRAIAEAGTIVPTRPESPKAWVSVLLPDEVMTDDPEQWRAPTSWEIRHVVGEGSFTGLPGARAAALVGVSPQNFRKYTAADGASTRQPISFAMWHYLLARLGVKKVGCAE